MPQGKSITAEDLRQVHCTDARAFPFYEKGIKELGLTLLVNGNRLELHNDKGGCQMFFYSADSVVGHLKDAGWRKRAKERGY